MSITYTLALVIASLITLNGVPTLGSSFDDKIYHVVAYFCLTFVWLFYAKYYKAKYVIYMICFAAILLGFILELLQFLVNKNRTYETYDLVANTIGAILGTLFAVKINIYKLN